MDTGTRSVERGVSEPHFSCMPSALLFCFQGDDLVVTRSIFHALIFLLMTIVVLLFPVCRDALVRLLLLLRGG